MTLLSIFDFGIGWLALLTIAFLVPAAFLFWQANRQSKQMSERQVRGVPGQPTPDTTGKPIKIYNLWTFRMGAFLIVAYIVALLMIRSDYRPYDPKKDGVPKEQTDTTRKAAEDMIPK